MGIVTVATAIVLGVPSSNLSDAAVEEQAANSVDSDSNTSEQEVETGTLAIEPSDDSVQFQARPVGSDLAAGTESDFPEELLGDAVELATAMRSSVVMIFERSGDITSGWGTGWLVQPDLILTNEHVVNLEDFEGELVVRTLSGDEFPAEIINTDSTADLAVVRIPEPIEAPPFKLSTERVRVGEPVIAVGHPSMIGNWVGMAGIVSAVDEYLRGAEQTPYVEVLTSLPISRGASGSAITRPDGAVVGIISHGSYEEIADAPLAPNVTVHTFLPRRDNSGGAGSEVILDFAERSGVPIEIAK